MMTMLFVTGALCGLVLGAAITWRALRNRPSAEQQARVLELTAGQAALQVALDKERESAEEKLRMLESARTQLADAFKALSSEALERNNRQFLDLAKTQLESFQQQAKSDLEMRQSQIGESLKPIKESLGRVDAQIQELEKARVGAYQSLSQQVDQLMREQVLLRGETSNLVGALKQPGVRGRWGEIQLRRVVELAGMLAHCDFFEQQSIDTESGRLRPDLIIKLPGNRHVIVDSKVPLSGYLAALESSDDATRTLKLQEHARAVKTHILALSRKGYAEQLRDSAEFVVLFLPGEVFFSAALEQDPSLIEAGVDQGVMIATPTSLIALLRAVHYGWRQEQIARNAEQISVLGKEIYERLSTMGEHWAKVGNSLQQAVDGYNKATASLESRVMVTARRFRDLDPALDVDKLGELESIDVTPRSVQEGLLSQLPKPQQD